MVKSQWSTVNGQWSKVNGQKSMVNSQWSMVNSLSSKLVGCVFIIAAVLKLISIDEFEIYIYSFDILSFLLTTFVSRIIIVGEFILGLFLILKINYKFIWKTSLIILILFTLFLIYAAIFREDSNCHCFGDLVELNPLESIIKNLILILLLLLSQQPTVNGQQSTVNGQQSTVNGQQSTANSQQPTVNGQQSTVNSQQSTVNSQQPTVNSQQPTAKVLVILLTCSLLVFIISPPDSIYKMIYSSEKEVSSIDLYESFDEVVKIDFKEDELIFDSISDFNTKENQLIVIVSSGCKYCKLGMKKLSLMIKNDDISPDNIDIFIWGSPEGIIDFRDGTMTEDIDYWHIMPNKAIDITYGRFPIFIMMENKNIIKVGDFRDLDDAFLNS